MIEINDEMLSWNNAILTYFLTDCHRKHSDTISFYNGCCTEKIKECSRFLQTQEQEFATSRFTGFAMTDKLKGLPRRASRSLRFD